MLKAMMTVLMAWVGFVGLLTNGIDTTKSGSKKKVGFKEELEEYESDGMRFTHVLIDLYSG